MTDRTQHIAGIVMAHIYSWTDDAKNKADIKFGRAALRAAVNMADDTVGIIELNDTLDHLVDAKHLKKLGRHLYGLGTGKGLKRYKATADSLFTRPADHGFNNSKTKHLLDNKDPAPESAGADKKPDEQPETSEQPEPPADTPAEPSPSTQYDAPVFVGDIDTARQARINQKLEQLRHKLGPRHIRDMPLKINVFDQLSDAISDPDITSVLDSIKNDLKGMAA